MIKSWIEVILTMMRREQVIVQWKGEGKKESLIREAKSQERETIKDVIIREREAQMQDLMHNLERAKFVITYLEYVNKQISHKQVLM